MSDNSVSLVIPGRNCERTLRQCLEAVTPMLGTTPLAEIIFVDDGSADKTRDIVADFPVTCIEGTGSGAGSARNLGWRAAKSPLVWFVDSDCVAQQGTLLPLIEHFSESKVGGVSGTYGIMNSNSLLACLIHEEIVQRHLSMPKRVDFLATFNVLYRHKALEKVGGFNERFLKAQDADLAFRVMGAGYDLHFDRRSVVNHYHPQRWSSYLKTQAQQGYWRVHLHLQHRGHSTGDSYSSLIDHVQPPLALAALVSLPLLAWPTMRWVTPAILSALLLAQLPLTCRILVRKRKLSYLAIGAMSFIRAFWRGIGMMMGVFACMFAGRSTTKSAQHSA